MIATDKDRTSDRRDNRAAREVGLGQVEPGTCRREAGPCDRAILDARVAFELLAAVA